MKLLLLIVSLSAFSNNIIFTKDSSGNISINDNKESLDKDNKIIYSEKDSPQTTPKIFTEITTKRMNQWHHDKIKTQSAWKYTQGEDTVVAVCDSGVSYTHPELRNRLVTGFNFVHNNTNTSPSGGHGTHVAGIIAGELNSAEQYHGIGPRIKIMPLRISTKGSTSMSRIVKCIKYAADNGAKVVNVSFTGVQNDSVELAGQYARQRGTLLVYSSGNAGKYKKYWPDHKNVVIVGATNQSDRLSYSNYGKMVDVVAPGKSIVSTNYLNGLYRSGSGTSYSAPVISATAALIFSLRPDLTPSQVEEVIIRSADKIGKEIYYGAGRVNIEKAMELASNL